MGVDTWNLLDELSGLSGILRILRRKQDEMVQHSQREIPSRCTAGFETGARLGEPEMQGLQENRVPSNSPGAVQPC